MLFCAQQQSQLHTTRLHNYTFDSDIKIIIINKIKNAGTHVFDGVHERRHAVLVRLVDVGAELDQILRRVETLLADRQNERRDLRGTCAQSATRVHRLYEFWVQLANNHTRVHICSQQNDIEIFRECITNLLLQSSRHWAGRRRAWG